MLNTGDGDLKVILSFDWPWFGFRCMEEGSGLRKLDGGEEGVEEEGAEKEAVDLVGEGLEVRLAEFSEVLKLFGRTTGKL